MCRIINDVLATKANVRVRAVDYGKSLAPLVEVLHGRYLRFDQGTRTINTWDYPGLEIGEMPDDLQKAFVVADLMHLARANDTIAEDILMLLVDEVYKNQVPRNRPGRPKHEPRLSHLLDLLESCPLLREDRKGTCRALRISLESFRDDPWIDAPTHSEFLTESQLDVYEIDSLQNLPDRVRQSMAFRIAAHVMRSHRSLESRRYSLAGTTRLSMKCGKWSSTTRSFSTSLNAPPAPAARKTPLPSSLPTPMRISPAVAMSLIQLALLSLKPLASSLSASKSETTARLIEETGLSPAAQSCIEGIKNVPGEHAQFLGVFGSGQDKIVEMLQVDLSPSELWTFTTNPDERNARARVQSLQPTWPMAVVIAWLAERYPRGLTAHGLTEIDESELTSKHESLNNE